MINSLGPDAPGEKFDEIIAGVTPAKNVVIDVQRFGEELENYAGAVDKFDRFAGGKPEGSRSSRLCHDRCWTYCARFEATDPEPGT